MKIDLKTLLILGFTISLLGCETRFEDDTRILVSGNLYDGLGNPVSNAEISVYRGENYISQFGLFPSFDDEYLLGRNYSDSQGEFSVTSLYDKDQYFKILIDAGDSYSKYAYQSNTENYIPENLTFNLEDLILYKIGFFNFSITRESGNGNSLQFMFKYVNPICVEIYEEGNLNSEESNCYSSEFFNGILNDASPNFERDFALSVGTQVEFTYSINDAPEIIEVLTINQENYEFAFSY